MNVVELESEEKKIYKCFENKKCFIRFSTLCLTSEHNYHFTYYFFN